MENLSQYSVETYWCEDIPYFEVRATGMLAEKIVLFLHGYTSSTEENLPSILKLASQGFTVIGIDTQHHGIRKPKDEEHASIGFSHFEKCVLMMNTCTDVIKVIDDLVIRYPDKKRALKIGVFGVSMGGMMAYCLACMDKRIMAIAPTIASPDWHAGMRWVGRILNAKKIAGIRGINPAANINKIFPTPILIQNGIWDKVIPIIHTEKHLPEFMRYYKGIEECLSYILHDCGHELIDNMVGNAANWFSKVMD